MRVQDVMTTGVIGVSKTATLAEAVETLLRSRVSALFVFDANHALVRVFSEGDLLRRSELGTDEKRPRWLEFLLSGGRLAEPYARTHGRRVGEIMTTNVATVSEDAELGDAVDLMLLSACRAAGGYMRRRCRRRHRALRPAQGPRDPGAERERPSS